MKDFLGIYIHIPFCIKKCPYCDFTSFEYMGREEEEKYVNYLIKEVELKRDNSFIVDTIYFGGGTPSLLFSDSLERILNTIFKNFSVADNPEISIEVNPGTVTEDKLKSWKSFGINRISLGVQSFLEKELKILGRIYSPEEIYKTYSLIRKFGFDNVNFDIIYSIPFQEFEDFKFSLRKAIDLSPEHISLYNLVIEENTPFYERWRKGELSLIDDEKEAEMFSFAMEFLSTNNFIQYEISNFSKDRKYFCKHNLKYWKQDPYLGFGVSAYSLILPFRYGNYKDLFVYYEKIDKKELPIEEREYLEKDNLIKDAIFVGLRLTEGINLESFKRKYGEDLRKFMPNYEFFIRKGFLEEKEGKVYLTREGILLANEILEDLF
ncbi:MAG: radical SAM family heme chaperone HemW [Dictyoglomaceae bacterium]